jgi:hypothetical protein
MPSLFIVCAPFSCRIIVVVKDIPKYMGKAAIFAENILYLQKNQQVFSFEPANWLAGVSDILSCENVKRFLSRSDRETIHAGQFFYA